MSNILTSIAGAKMWIIGGVAAAAVLAAGAGTLYYVAYNKGLQVSKTEISKYEGKVAELNQKITEAQGKTTTEYQTQYLDRVVERERVVYRNREVIVSAVPEQYMLSEGWVYAHDQAAQGKPIYPNLAASPAPSRFSDLAGLKLATENYSICQANADQLTAFQNWWKAQQEVINEANSNR